MADQLAGRVKSPITGEREQVCDRKLSGRGKRGFEIPGPGNKLSATGENIHRTTGQAGRILLVEDVRSRTDRVHCRKDRGENKEQTSPLSHHSYPNGSGRSMENRPLAHVALTQREHTPGRLLVVFRPLVYPQRDDSSDAVRAVRAPLRHPVAKRRRG